MGRYLEYHLFVNGVEERAGAGECRFIDQFRGRIHLEALEVAAGFFHGERRVGKNEGDIPAAEGPAFEMD